MGWYIEITDGRESPTEGGGGAASYDPDGPKNEFKRNGLKLPETPSEDNLKL